MSENKLICCSCRGYWSSSILFLIKISNNRLSILKHASSVVEFEALCSVALANFLYACEEKLSSSCTTEVHHSYNHGITPRPQPHKAFYSSAAVVGPGNLR